MWTYRNATQKWRREKLAAYYLMLINPAWQHYRWMIWSDITDIKHFSNKARTSFILGKSGHYLTSRLGKYMHVKWFHLHNINIPCTLVIWNETPENRSHHLAALSECPKNKCPTTTVIATDSSTVPHPLLSTALPLFFHWSLFQTEATRDEAGIATLVLHARSIFARGRKVSFFVGSQL
jgi:hypothetical protein